MDLDRAKDIVQRATCQVNPLTREEARLLLKAVTRLSNNWMREAVKKIAEQEEAKNEEV